MGVSLEDVRTAVANANSASPLGTFDGPDLARTIGSNDQLRSPRRVPEHRGQGRQRHRGAARRHRLGRGGRAQQPLGGLVQPAAVGAARHHQAGRRQRHRHGRPHPRAAAGAQALDSGRHRDLGAVRPHPDDPRQRARHAAHAGRHHRAGDDGGVPVPAPPGGDDRRRRHGAARAGGHLRADVGRRLLDRQHLADGARGLGRLRGRRRHRHDRERVPQSREGHDAAARHDRGRAPDRLHGASRSASSLVAAFIAAVVHGRRGRPAVHRILA